MAFDIDPQFKTEDGSMLRIWEDAAPSPYWSEKLGRPVFDTVLYVEVISPGSASSSPVFEVERTFNEDSGIKEPHRSEKYKEYRKFIEQFRDGNTHTDLSGTPLTEWPEISRTLAASLRASGVFSVESLAALPDEKLRIVGPDGRSWRTKAQAYLETSKNAGYATALAAEKERLTADLAEKDKQLLAMSEQITKMQAQIDAFTALGGDKTAAPAPKAGKTAPLV